MMWGRALNKAPRASGVPSTFTKWRDLAAYSDQWRVLCGAKARGAVHTPPKHPRDIWAQVVDGLPPLNPTHNPVTAASPPTPPQGDPHGRWPPTGPDVDGLERFDSWPSSCALGADGPGGLAGGRWVGERRSGAPGKTGS